MKSMIFRTMSLGLLFALSLTASGFARDGNNMHTSKPFMGVKANTGTVSHTRQGTQNILTLSDDFVVPDAPAPSWQIVDSRGNVYLLQQLRIKGGKFNRSIVLPGYIKDIAKVQIWCSFAETLLGEATFDGVIKL